MRFRSSSELKRFLNGLWPALAGSAYWLGFGLLVAVGVVSYADNAALIKVNRTQFEFRDLQNAVQEVLSTVQDAETGQRGYLLTGEDAYLDPYRAAVKAVNAKIDQVESLVGVVPEQRSNVETLRSLIFLTLAELNKTIDLQRDHGFEPALQLVRTDRGKRLMDEVRSLVAGLNHYVEVRFKDNVRQTVSLSTQTVVWGILGNLSGAVLFFVVFKRQIRERKRSEELILNQSDEEIRKLNQELEQRVLERTAQLAAANTELEAFSYSVSHDLRAPLRAIDGFSRILLEDFAASLAPEAKDYLNLVRNSTRQMGQLVDDLLAFSRLGRQALAKHTVDPDKIVRRCLEEMTKEQQGRQVEIVIGDLPACNADPTLLKQVWLNLLANAFKYTRKQEAARIEIGCRTQPRPSANGQPSSPADARPEVVYFVKDNGAGFNMKYAHKLFGVFQRLHRAIDYEGTGVGLAIVQRIVQRHGGRVWGDGIVHQGATFSFTLE